MGTVNIEVIDENKDENVLYIDDKIDACLQGLRSGWIPTQSQNGTPQFHFGGQFKKEEKVVDYYNDGEHVGDYVGFSAGLKGDFDITMMSQPFPIPAFPAVYVRVGIGIEGSLSVSGTASYDDSKAQKTDIALEVEGKFGGGVTVAAGIGNPNLMALEATASGETSWSAKGSPVVNGANDWKLKGTIEAGTLEVTGSASFLLFGEEVASYQFMNYKLGENLVNDFEIDL